MKAMKNKEQRLHKREIVDDSKSLRTILFSTNKSIDCHLKNISEGGIQVSCQTDSLLNNNMFNGMFKYHNEGRENEVTYSFIAEKMWVKKTKNKELLVGLKLHPVNDKILSIIP